MDAPEGTTTRRHFLELATLLAAGTVVAGAGEVGATPATGKSSRTPLAQGRVDERITVATHGPADFHIQHVLIEPGADTGWHTHPGHALDIVKSGTITLYVDGEDCKGRTYKAGEAMFVPAGVAHFGRNDGSEPAEAYVTYLVAAGAVPRADAAHPTKCPS